MALKHILKHSETEIVFKCYMLDNSGGTIDLSLEHEMTKSTQEYVAPSSFPDESGNGTGGLGPFVDFTGSRVHITGLWWGVKHNKHLDVTRIVATTPVVLHGHYFLVNSGFYDFTDFSDRLYANRDVRLIFDGPGHCIIRLRKEGWVPKIELASFGRYDNPNVVGS